jgi:predicted NAD/FAD-dependent oxidoreductase
MSALVRSIATGLDIRFGAEVAAVDRAGGRWRLRFADGAPEYVDSVIVAAPAPQTTRLCAGVPAVAEAAAAASMTHCWAILAAWDTLDAAAPDRVSPEGTLAAATRVSGKPGRAPSPARWVGHADPGWTAETLERPPEAVAPALLAALGDAIGLEPAAVRYAAAHRWRYARVSRPVGLPCLVAPGGLVAAGDWLLGPDAADAHASGLAAAEAVRV